MAVRKKNSISIGHIEPAQNPHQKTLKKHYNNNKYRHFKLSFESLQKHKQDSLNNKPKTDSQPPDFDQSSDVQLLCLPKISGSCGYTPHTLETINFTDLISVKSNENLINLKISTLIHS